MEAQRISKNLQELVSWSVAILGNAIKKEYGITTFNRVEKLRVQMKKIRGHDPEIVYKKLELELKKMQKYSDLELKRICYSFSLMLELINRCEVAYRDSRLENYEHASLKKLPERIIFVLTAHPTEARSPEFLELFKDVELVLKRALIDKSKNIENILFHTFILSLKISLARNLKPTIKDEAQNIYRYVLHDDILNSIIHLTSESINVSFRTWVGGDKDGHPGVDEKVMLESLSLSREMLADFIKRKLIAVKQSILLLKHEKCVRLESKLNLSIESLSHLMELRAFDGIRVTSFKKSVEELYREYEKKVSVLHPDLIAIKNLLWTFPALVLPLEIREDSEVVKEALAKESDFAISRMLTILSEISKGYNAKWYVRGFVLSMVQNSEDIINGYKLSRYLLGSYKIPVVPLFENEIALTNATTILDEVFFKNKMIAKTHIQKWGAKYEVMVGYSDSSKENGVLPSRLMIATALKKIEECLKSYALRPVFFHGSGGSIERGGGSLKEQISWWPRSALNIFKSTIQGEMVARNFASGNIFEKQVYTIAEQLDQHKVQSIKRSKIIKKFSEEVRKNYSLKIQDETFLEVIHYATPYSFLHHLKIGSRPSKRSQGSIKEGLRAIPWILCWTQTRTLFPTWWGIGPAWNFLTSEEQGSLKKEFQQNPVLMAYLKALGFTLAKVELGVWKIYLSHSKLNKKIQKEIFDEFCSEFKQTLIFFNAVTGHEKLLWFRPWLQQSIDYRSSMIHPINLCQIESLRRNDLELLRNSVTGIACGMLTTG